MPIFAGVLNKEVISISDIRGRWSLIWTTVALTFVFIMLFEPYGSYGDYSENKVALFVEIGIASAVLLVAMMISQFVIRPLLKLKRLSYLTLVGWVLVEFVLIGLLWTLTSMLLDTPTPEFGSAFVTNLIQCSFLVLPPYVVAILFVNYRYRSRELVSLQQAIEESKVDPDTLIPFEEKNGKLKVSLKLSDLLYVESNDNYVNVIYLEGGDSKRIVLRNTIKNMEQLLMPYNVIRCHRSYLVNIMNVRRHEKSAQKGATLYFGAEIEAEIPVSKIYLSEVEKALV